MEDKSGPLRGGDLLWVEMTEYKVSFDVLDSKLQSGHGKLINVQSWLGCIGTEMWNSCNSCNNFACCY